MSFRPVPCAWTCVWRIWTRVFFCVSSCMSCDTIDAVSTPEAMPLSAMPAMALVGSRGDEVEGGGGLERLEHTPARRPDLHDEAARHRIVAEVELAPGGVEPLRVGEGGVHLRQHAGRRARRDAPGAVRGPEPAGRVRPLRRVVAEIEGHVALVIGRNPV